MLRSARGPATFALVLAALGLGGLPWYDVADGFWRFGWRDAWPAGAAAPLAVLASGRAPHLAPLVVCALAALVAALLPERSRDTVTAAAGAIGFVWLLAQGFHAGVKAQPGLGAGGLAMGSAFLLFAADGLAGRGWMKGERFTAAALLVCLVATLLFVFYPVVRILAGAFVDDDGAFSPAALAGRLAGERIWSLACLRSAQSCGSAWNTLILGVLTGLVTTAIGLALALLVSRTHLPGRKLLGVLSVLPIVTPPFVIGLALILVFGRSGVVNLALDRWLGIPPSRWFYGLDGVLVAQIFAFTPIAFLILRGVVEGISPTLEEASRALHASDRQTFRRITLPLLRPGLANAFLVGFIESIADFGNPLLLGGSFNVLATEIYFAIVGAQHDPGKAAGLALVLLALALAAFALQRAFVARRSFVTVTGKGDAGIPLVLHRSASRWCALVAAPFALLTIVIYAMALVGGIVEIWGRDHSLTLRHFAKAFAIESTPQGLVFAGAAWPSLGNTLLFAAIAAPLGAIIGLASAWLIERTTFPGRRAFEFLTLVSFAIPGTILGLAYILAFNVPPIEITGTGLVIVLSFVFRNLPVGVRAGAAAFAQIDRSLDEASATLGARAGTGLRRVLLPMLRPAIVATLVYGFVRSVTTVSAIVFLVSGETEVATTYIIGRAVNGDYGVASAYSAALIVLMIAVIGLIQLGIGSARLGRRDLAIQGGTG